MDYHYRTVSITIGSKEFDLDQGYTLDQVFAYVEDRFGFYCEKWQEAKEAYDSETMGEMIKELGVEYSEVFGC